jgi:hypothetical protein
VRISVGKCLHPQIVANVGGELVVIPATEPTGLPWGQWVEVARSAEHWRLGVWVEEVVEVKLPDLVA